MVLFQNLLQSIPEDLLSCPNLTIDCDHNPVWAELFRRSQKQAMDSLGIEFCDKSEIQIKQGLRDWHEKSSSFQLSLYYDPKHDIDHQKMHSARYIPSGVPYVI